MARRRAGTRREGIVSTVTGGPAAFFAGTLFAA
jgi:hypothetical protein